MTALTLRCCLATHAPLAQIGELRRAAWAPLVGVDRANQRFGIDDDDHDAWHIVIRLDETPIAAGRLAPRPTLDGIPEAYSFAPWLHAMAAPVGFASRLTVHPDHQGRGMGERIIVGRIELARRLGLTQVWGETRTGHIHGLERHGYRLLGQSTDESVPGVWHIMCAPLTVVGADALDAVGD